MVCGEYNLYIMRKIDAHCHTTKRILKDSANPDASLSAIKQQMAAHHVERTVLLATYFPERGSGVSNYRLAYWIKDWPEFVMFGSLDFEHYFYQGLNELEEMAGQGLICGIKLYTAYQQIDFQSDKFKLIVRLAQQYDLPLMFHGGVSYNLWKQLSTDDILALASKNDASTKPEDFKTPQDFAHLAETYPDVPLIVSHLCKPFFEEMMTALQRYDNLFTDMSGILDSKRDLHYRDHCVEQVSRFVNECGSEKLLFGTDFPVQTHNDSVYFIETAMTDFSDTDKQKVYYDNAQRLIFG